MRNEWDELRTYISMLEHSDHNKEIKSVYLYGSYSKGNNSVDSDVDLIIVSDTFIGLNQYLRIRLFQNIWDYFKLQIDLICMTVNEFQLYQKSNAFLLDQPIQIYRGKII